MEKIINAIKLERENQDIQWGKEHDDIHFINDWIAILVRLMGRMQTIYAHDNPITIRSIRAGCIEIAAVAIACAESMDRKLAKKETT